MGLLVFCVRGGANDLTFWADWFQVFSLARLNVFVDFVSLIILIGTDDKFY